MHDVVLDYPLSARGNNVPVGQVADRLLICGNDRVPEGGWHPLDATNNRVVSKATQQRWTGGRFLCEHRLYTGLHTGRRVLTEKNGGASLNCCKIDC